MGKSGDFVTKV